MQGYWFKKAFLIADKQFERNTMIALKNVAYTILRYNSNQSDPVEPVCRFTDNYFIVQINDSIDPSLIEVTLMQELKKQQVNFDFEYSIFDCSNQEIIHTGKLNMVTNQLEKGSPFHDFPVNKTGFNYFGVLFPGKNAGILSQMEMWICSSLALLIVLGFFAYALISLFKQKRLSEIQTDFLNTMTHELRTPVASLNLAAQVLLKQQDNMEEARKKRYLEVVVKESYRLQEYVERFLQIAKTESDAVVVRQEIVHLNPFLQEVKEDFNIRNHHASDKLVLQLPETSQYIFTDTFHLRQMLFNLLDNALKYGPSEAPIILRMRVFGQNLHLEVEDQGPGLPQKVQKLVFSRFYRQTQGDRYEQQGFGLGLYYVAQMAKRLKARTGYRHSEGNKGSVFYIQFKLT